MIRGANGRRHEVDFGDAPVRVEIYSTEETVEIFIEVDFERLPEERRRFALLNIPRHLFSEATAAAARRTTSPRPVAVLTVFRHLLILSGRRSLSSLILARPAHAATRVAIRCGQGPAHPEQPRAPSETGTWNRWIVSSTRSRR
jgi:hypothetical protein